MILSQEQQQIVYARPDQNMKIVASAGSGKTTTILQRVKNLIENLQVEPSKIILTSFNIKAAVTIRDRLLNLMCNPFQVFEIYIANIDKLAYHFYHKYVVPHYQKLQKSLPHLSVVEYCREMLNYIQTTEEGKQIIAQYRYFFFDEFQDANETQYQILVEFYKVGCHIVVIGDDAQNIYQFRGSDINLIQQQIHQDIKNIDVFFLTLNYRSTPQIVSLANQIVKHSSKLIFKEMKSVCNSQNCPEPQLLNFRSAKLTNLNIIKQIIKLREDGIGLSEIAILAPTNLPLKFLEEEIEKWNLQNPQNKIFYEALISQNDQSSNKSSISSQNSNYKDFMNINGSITISTIHQAKGLEWNYVFLLSCNDEFFSDSDEIEQLEEKRRLFYVAVTRAARQLQMFVVINEKYYKMTRFLAEIIIDSPRDNIMQYFYFDIDNIDQYCYIWIQNEKKAIQDAQDKHQTTVTGILSLFDENFFQKLREQNIVPDSLASHQEQIHRYFKISNEINQSKLHQDFGGFIDRYITRTVCEQFNCPQPMYRDMFADIVLNAFYLNAEKINTTYLKYKDKLLLMLKDKIITSLTQISELREIFIGNLMQDMNQNLNQEQKNDLDNLVNLFTRLIHRAKQKNIEIDAIYIINKEYFPEDYSYDHLKQSYCRYQDPTLKNKDLIDDIYNVSLFGQIFDQRRRLLFLNVKDLFTSVRDGYNILVKESITKDFIQYLKSQHGDHQENSYQSKLYIYNEDYGIEGEIDLLVNQTIYEYKVSQYNQDKTPLEWILQMLAYAALYRMKYNIQILNIVLYNALQGTITSYDISNWNRHQELLAFMSQVRYSKSKKTIINTQASTVMQIEQSASIQQYLLNETQIH